MRKPGVDTKLSSPNIIASPKVAEWNVRGRYFVHRAQVALFILTPHAS
jgi:hypothetical protein